LFQKEIIKKGPACTSSIVICTLSKFENFKSYPYHVYLKRRSCTGRFSQMVSLGWVAAFLVTIMLWRGIVEVVVTLRRQRRCCG